MIQRSSEPHRTPTLPLSSGKTPSSPPRDLDQVETSTRVPPATDDLATSAASTQVADQVLPPLHNGPRNLDLPSDEELERQSPPTKPDTSQSRFSGSTYTVKRGDYLIKIAREMAGSGKRWRELYALNKDLIGDNPGLIRTGAKLKIPASWGRNGDPSGDQTKTGADGQDKTGRHGHRKAGEPGKTGDASQKHHHTSTGTTTTDGPGTSTASDGSLFARHNDWYISQEKTQFNTNEDVKNNGNCGPTSITMIAKAFGKINPSAAEADAAIDETRRRAGGGTNEHAGTSVGGLVRAAESYGLDAKSSGDASPDKIAAELAKGRLVVVHVVPKYVSPHLTGGHYTVVTKIEGDKVYLNDPGTRHPIVITRQQLSEAIAARGTYRMISIGD